MDNYIVLPSARDWGYDPSHVTSVTNGAGDGAASYWKVPFNVPYVRFDLVITNTGTACVNNITVAYYLPSLFELRSDDCFAYERGVPCRKWTATAGHFDVTTMIWKFALGAHSVYDQSIFAPGDSHVLSLYATKKTTYTLHWHHAHAMQASTLMCGGARMLYASEVVGASGHLCTRTPLPWERYVLNNPRRDFASANNNAAGNDNNGDVQNGISAQRTVRGNANCMYIRSERVDAHDDTSATENFIYISDNTEVSGINEHEFDNGAVDDMDHEGDGVSGEHQQQDVDDKHILGAECRNGTVYMPLLGYCISAYYAQHHQQWQTQQYQQYWQFSFAIVLVLIVLLAMFLLCSPLSRAVRKSLKRNAKKKSHLVVRRLY